MLKDEVIKILHSVGIRTSKEVLEVPPQEIFGDIAFPCFGLAKQEHKNPQEIAGELVNRIRISKNPLIIKTEARGGYVNFFFYWEKVGEKILSQILSRRKINIGNRKKIMIEYSQPNPVHPMHIGHARGTFLGDALANIYDYLGYRTIRANYMNDIGLQVARLVAAYKLWAENKKPKGKPDFWLWQYYVKFHEELSKNAKLDEKARELLRKFELERNKATIKIWNKIVKWCVQGFNESYRNLGIKFHVYFYENEFREAGKSLVDKALNNEIAFRSPENAIVANLEKYGLPNCILLRSDGTGLYITSDLGLTFKKFQKYQLDKSVWAVSSQQNLHFKQLFKILELLDYKFVKDCEHFSFEHVNLPEGKMSSREGKAVMLDEVITSLTKQALEEVEKRNPRLSKQKKLGIAKKIAVGALKYSILKIEPENSITFDWKQMLSFEGNTGPYLQYAHTRCLGILKKAKKHQIVLFSKLSLHEKQLIKVLMNFDDVLLDSAKNYRPNFICNYAYEIATAFSNFYQNCPVLKANDKKQRDFRLTLVMTTKIVLENSLKLLGIKVPERM
ncbi:MAG: arginine--tRNA ligase [Candidatus Aenigmarchaeota archaeon]|nr:arginine--tRNA ligase [Candidatus Aenigmarchaeota archaeon]